MESPDLPRGNPFANVFGNDRGLEKSGRKILAQEELVGAVIA
jgi:hypothetical protein